ncbi:MAG TPA: hypothetical protein VE377_27255, partial [Candidatus Dormibacteraeota bacterium]|nr:hypothetical protein [Candidatus Dormibacteraeota bacterium]
DFDNERDAAGAATYFILDHSQPGDGIVFYIPPARAPFEFYRARYYGGDSRAVNRPDHLEPQILYPYYSQEGLDFRDFKAKLSADFLRQAVPNHPRVWVVLMYTSVENPDSTCMMLTKVLGEAFPHQRRWEFFKVEVLLYSWQEAK